MDERNNEIVRRFLAGETITALGAEFGVTKQAVHNIVTRYASPASTSARRKRRTLRAQARKRKADRGYKRRRRLKRCAWCNRETTRRKYCSKACAAKARAKYLKDYHATRRRR